MSFLGRKSGSGHRARGTGHRVQGTEHRAQSTGHRAQSTGHGAQGTEYRAQSTGHRAQSTGHRAGQQKNTLNCLLVRYNNVITWFQVLFLIVRYIERDSKTKYNVL